MSDTLVTEGKDASERFRTTLSQMISQDAAATDCAAPEPPPEHTLSDYFSEATETLLGVSDSEPKDEPTRSRSFDSSQAEFFPRAPMTLYESGLRASEVEALILKWLLNQGTTTGRLTADQIGLPFRLVEGILRRMKEAQLVVYKAAAAMSDYVYELTEQGHARAQRHCEHCTYCGTAPVPLEEYVASVHAQSIRKQKLTLNTLATAFSDLLLTTETLSQLGQAINSGLGLFLYGAPGNGKTSIAERATGAFGKGIWIPRAITVLGEIIRVYDPGHHEVLAPNESDSSVDTQKIDHRWMHIRRPTIAVGGELTMKDLEITLETQTGVHEAPLQMKANCGTLIIDDFGRQQISPSELLNRWIVPLEKRYDFLTLRNGRKLQVPFDQLIIFSTNLEPRDLVDEAFLRRIPYKINIEDPSEDEFRRLFQQRADQLGIAHDNQTLDYLIEKHYKQVGRPMRFCHPRDLLQQTQAFCEVYNRPPAISREAVDAAVKNYFATVGT